MNDRLQKLPRWAQDHIKSLEDRVLRAEAELRDEPTPELDVPPPPSSSPTGTLSKGWAINRHRGIGAGVFKACSSYVHHGEGWDKTTTQQPIHLYSTELRATQALRAEFVAEHRKNIAAIDRRIDLLKANEAKGN